ncbi:Golgi membrane protein 1 isoform X1 [Pleuronectes platessa]|uniref:Golgi membrane protein 1 isoform X1 n=1 Tax=Pleuronectes platessa TaxID=8262 RepID=UPI00232A5306|nr:Golgi membrane protein 1 isoform X1 [Pleuronectes platessa]
MGGLGNVRRAGRSPPLMIGALIACILVLGFNYWVCSSRNLELQTKLYEMEGQVRRGAAERGVSEIKKNEFQEEIQRQKEQISHQESLFKRQMEALEMSCNQEKDKLQENMSSSAKITQELRGRVNQLNEEVGKLQKELQSCQGNINTLNSKLTYDMTQCHSQVLSQKELCDERVAAAKLEVQKKMEKLINSPSVVSSQQEKTMDRTGKADRPVLSVADPEKTSTVVSHTPSVSRLKENEPTELLTNEIIVDQGSDEPVPSVNEVSKEELQSVPSAAAGKQDILPPLEGAVKTNEAGTETSKLMKNNLTEDEDMELMDVHEEGTQTEDPGMEGMLIGQGKVDEMPDGQKLEPEEYDADKHIVGGADSKNQQQIRRSENIDKDMEEELADYNGDDENEGEFEADKQAELAQH